MRWAETGVGLGKRNSWSWPEDKGRRPRALGSTPLSAFRQQLCGLSTNSLCLAPPGNGNLTSKQRLARLAQPLLYSSHHKYVKTGEGQ